MVNRLVQADDRRFDLLYGIYRNSIAPREQKSKAELSAMLARSDYLFLVYQERTDVRGFSICFVAERETFCLLEYMAVDESERGRGIGSKLFKETVDTVHRGYGFMPMLVEIDSERECSPEQEVRLRRQSFYRGVGCRRIENCVYILPLPGTDPPPQMDLFVYVSTPLATVARATLRQWLATVYHSVYGRSANDIRIDEMVCNLPDPVKLI